MLARDLSIRFSLEYIQRDVFKKTVFHTGSCARKLVKWFLFYFPLTVVSREMSIKLHCVFRHNLELGATCSCSFPKTALGKCSLRHLSTRTPVYQERKRDYAAPALYKMQAPFWLLHPSSSSVMQLWLCFLSILITPDCRPLLAWCLQPILFHSQLRLRI